MAGPWEQYQSAAPAPTDPQPVAPASDSGPWSQYQAAQAPAPVDAAATAAALPQTPTPEQSLAAAPDSDPRKKFVQDAIAKFPTEREQFDKEQAARGDRGVLGSVSDFFTGADRQTERSKNLPELSGLLQNQGAWDNLKTTAALAITPNNDEAAQILKAANPNLTFDKDAAGNVIGYDPKTGAQALVNAPGASLLDGLQTGTGLLAYAPAGGVASAVGGGVLKQAATLGAASAATEAAIQSGQAAAGGEFNPEDVAISGLVGAVSPLIGGGTGALADGAKRVAGAVRGDSGAVDPLVQAAASNKIPLLSSDISPPTTAAGELAQRTAERIPFAGTGGLRAEQQAARTEAVDNIAAQYGPPSPTEIIDSLKSQASVLKRAAGNRIGEFSNTLDAAGTAPYTNTANAIDSAIAALSRPGVTGSPDAVRELQALKTTLGSAGQTYSTLKENRTAFNELVKGYDSPLRSQLPSRAKSLLSSVQSALTSDMDDFAKANLTPRDVFRLKQANAVYAQEADKLTKTRLKNVLDKGNLTPEVAENLLFSKKPSEVQSLYNSLGMQGRQAARATIVQRLVNSARVTGETSPDRFLNALNKMENQTGIFFKGDARKQLLGLGEVLHATRRAGRTGITSTGQESSLPLSVAAAGAALGSFGSTLVLGGSIGGIARLYESAPVRNALISIGKQPNSQASRDLALKLARELNAGFQTSTPGADPQTSPTD
jgi:hypothetical protein